MIISLKICLNVCLSQLVSWRYSHNSCICFEDSESDPKPNNKGLGGFKGRRRVYEAPKPQNYYHLEYKLLPDDADIIKTDVVTYGVAAKIYTESDSKVMKTWRDGDKTWVAWTHRWLTEGFVIKLRH